jgi:hypothetical protein
VSEHPATTLLQKLAALTDQAAAEALGPRKGFILFLFDFGERGDMHYISNAEREDACTALAEYLSTQAPEILLVLVRRVQAQQVLGPERVH